MPALERERLRALGFDTFVIIDTHWFTTARVHPERQRAAGGRVYLGRAAADAARSQVRLPRRSRARNEVEAAARASGSARDRARPISICRSTIPTLNVMHYFNSRARPAGAGDRGLPDRRGQERSGVRRRAGTGDPGFGAARGAGRFGRIVTSVLGLRSDPGARFRLARGHQLGGKSRLRREDHALVSRPGDHAEVLAAAEDYRARCSPEGRFSHYLVMAGAMGAETWNWRGEQFGRYEVRDRHRPGDLLLRPPGLTPAVARTAT